MGVAFYNLDSEAGIKKLDEYLLTRSYISGYQASKDDLAVHAALAKPPSSNYVNASRWYNHIEALLRISGVSGEGCDVTVEGSAPIYEDTNATPPVADTKGDERSGLGDAQFRRLTRRIDAMHDMTSQFAADMTSALSAAFQAIGVTVTWPVFGANSVYPPPDTKGDERSGLGDAQFRRLTRRIDAMHDISRQFAADLTSALSAAFQATGVTVTLPVFGAHSVYPPPDSSEEGDSDDE